MTTTTKDRLIFHESGHAILSVAAGLPFFFLAQSGDNFGLLQLEFAKIEQFGNKQFRDAYAVTCTGGAMAESLKYGGGGLHSLVGGLGMTDLRNLTSIGLSTPEILSACYKSELYLKTNWQSVERLAAALEKNSLMLEADVRAAAGDLPNLFESKPKPVSKDLRQSFKASTKSLWMRQCLAVQSFRS